MFLLALAKEVGTSQAGEEHDAFASRDALVVANVLFREPLVGAVTSGALIVPLVILKDRAKVIVRS